MNIPKQVQKVLDILNQNGFEAYIVGGCVRDMLLKKFPKDYDVTTSACPQKVTSLFKQYRVIETGLKHGTVTIRLDSMPVEVTTYRIDGVYTDNRHPDQVCFTQNLREDLSRRDFTVNALAFHPDTGIIDYFSGIEDLWCHCIRCVGDASKRFHEDALRILRALRFASVLGFTIEQTTSSAVLNCAPLLATISIERVASELIQLLCGINCRQILRQFSAVIALVLPEISPMFDCRQNHPCHQYNVWEHTLHAIEAIDPDPVLRLAALFHDIGKPLCRTTDETHIDHFYGHAIRSREIAQTALIRLRLDNDTIHQVCTLVEYHDHPLILDSRAVKRLLNKLGEPLFRKLLRLKRADHMAQTPDPVKQSVLDETEATLEQILLEQSCISLKQLAVSGSDLLTLGIPRGPEIGKMLNFLLEQVIEGNCPNRTSDLLRLAKQPF